MSSSAFSSKYNNSNNNNKKKNTWGIKLCFNIWKWFSGDRKKHVSQPSEYQFPTSKDN